MVSREWFPRVAAVAKKCPIMMSEIFSYLAKAACARTIQIASALRALCVLTGHLLTKFLMTSFAVHVLAHLLLVLFNLTS